MEQATLTQQITQQILGEAYRDMLAGGEAAWCQGKYAHDSTGNGVFAYSPLAVRWCTTGRILAAARRATFSLTYPSLQVLEAALAAVKCADASAARHGARDLVDLNDRLVDGGFALALACLEEAWRGSGNASSL